MKPVVHYKELFTKPIAGKCAMVFPIDHTNHVFGQNVSNTKPVLTSTVVATRKNGEFETLNTIYKPMEKP
jgi:hypothetical protein